VPPALIAFGEIGLTGEVRPVAYGDERLREARGQGFSVAIVPQGNAPRRAPDGLSVIAVTRIAEALEAALAGAG
jgi:DNA repair protein RadA/Sms